MEEKELFKRYKKLYTALIADIMDQLNYRNQSMEYTIRPLIPDSIIVGKAFTILSVQTYETPKKPYDKELEAIDKLKEGDVIVCTTNGETICGFWGELLATAAKVRGCNGTITDGLTRDARALIKMGFPTFAKGYSPNDSKGRNLVIDYNCLIVCGGIRVNPGDLIMADFEGIVVVPRDIEETVLLSAEKKFYGENIVRKELAKGKSIVEVFDKYKIL